MANYKWPDTIYVLANGGDTFASNPEYFADKYEDKIVDEYRRVRRLRVKKPRPEIVEESK